ncbi:pilus assembly protein [Noviherbaspirillum massiliense]|uniref:pilus assembly protein n=1 Tax=Noviherbaspirillum massiliense TaxID=1465823 RepID=UPI001375C861|nr:PilC/PilY family type IV pilus protein [Noviherbaspirillum massiliense]
MTLDRPFKAIRGLLIVSAFIAAQAGATDISTEPLNTYSATSSTDVKPNVFFVLDDSGSMDWDFMPDWACASYSTTNSSCSSTGQDPRSTPTQALFRNAAYNGIYYNPAITYKPPIAVDSSGALDTSKYPSMTGMSTATGANSTTKPNWKAVKNDAYGVQSTSSSDLQSNPPSFYTIVAGEYCTSASLRTCVTANAPTTVGGVAYNFPAKLRWCDSTGLSNCRAAFDTSFSYARAPSPRETSITISSVSSGASITSIKVNSQEILPATVTAGSNSTSAMAAAIAAAINNCNGTATGNCTVRGFAAEVSGSTVTITAGMMATLTTPSISRSGSVSWNTLNAFTTSAVPGYNLKTVIVPGTSAVYPFPGTTAKHTDRKDCAGSLCTGNEEMINYANWWTYYRTRMQMMKTAASNAFAQIDSASDLVNNVSRFRLGYMSINNNTGSDFLNLGEFAGAQKYNWYNKLISANPNSSTPVRAALAKAGRLYAGKLNGQTLNGSRVVDPLQYSCQQNYTILSTDGFWNEGSGFNQMDGSTTVGNQDAGLPRPYYDGGSARLQTRTSRLQTRTGKLQKRTKSGSRWGSWSNATSCMPGTNTQCQYSWGSWANTSTSCTVNYSSGSGNWTIANGTDCQYAAWTSWANASSCTPAAQSPGPNYTVITARECETNPVTGTFNTLADVAAYYYGTDLRDPDPDLGTGTCTGPVVPPATTPNNLCDNNVPANGRDVATTQHMTTFTLGLGAQGKMIYAPNDGKDYWNDTSGDFYDVLKGTNANPATGICSWQSSGACNWPTPVSNENTTIDDLWHAAVNGRGAYFSAKDPTSLADSLTSTLKSIMNTPRPGTAAAAASSNPNVSASDNYVFSSSYKSIEWYGELIRQQITETGTLTAQNWSAMKLVDCATTTWQPSTTYVVGNVYRRGSSCYTVTQEYTSGTTFDGSSTGTDGANIEVVHVDEAAESPVAVTAPTSRTIYTKGAAGLISFDWASLQTAGLTSHFTTPHISFVSDTVGLSQFCSSGGNCLSDTDQTNAAGEALVNFFRGDRSNEGSYFRQRTHVLGDIVSSEARYVQAPMFNYIDAGYSAFKTAKAARSGTVYVGANDGMLHAFDAATGKELWAYVPSMVLPDLYKLADKNYASKHQFLVDASPETGDICPNAPASTCTGSQWKTILVGGLNRGGKGYYALDITNPASPTLLWEFTNANLGYSYGNPKITKLKDGTWVVLLSSGYNNADGIGRLFVLNANTGALIRTISTSVGTSDNPSGMARISAHAPQSMTDNTTVAAYGGDTYGNLWRFDVNGDIGDAGYDAQLLATFKDEDGKPQPVTVKPLEATVNGMPIVYVGTGRFLGVSDVGDTSKQSFYAVKDNLGNTSYGNPRLATNKFVKQTLTDDNCPADAPTTVCAPGQTVRTGTNNPVDWGINNGWYMDFLVPGERSSSDPSLGLGTLLFTTITPQSSSMSACGATAANSSGSFVYALDYLTGGPVEGSSGVVGINLGSSLVTRPVLIEQADGTVRALIRTSSGASSGTDLGGTVVITPPVKPSIGSGTRRVSWRVLTTR